MTVITEAELRELWQNGRGSLPDFPPGARFTPAAKDFLAAHPLPASPAAQACGGGGRSPVRVFFTEQDVIDLAARGETTLALGEADRLTALAQERAAALGVRITRPAAGPPPTSAAPRSHNPPVLPEPPAQRPRPEPAMRKTFLTDVDIEDLARRGETRLEINPDVVLTDLAREKAARLGIELAPAAVGGSPASVAPTPGEDEALFQAVRAGVLARLPAGVDASLVDAVIRKVIAGL